MIVRTPETEPVPAVTMPGRKDTMPRKRTPAANRTRKNAAHAQRMFAQSVLAGRRAARADAAQVVAANLRQNPNTGKRKHRVTGTRATGPRMSDRTRTDPRKELLTYGGWIDRDRAIVSKNRPAGRIRGEVTLP